MLRRLWRGATIVVVIWVIRRRRAASPDCQFTQRWLANSLSGSPCEDMVAEASMRGRA